MCLLMCPSSKNTVCQFSQSTINTWNILQCLNLGLSIDSNFKNQFYSDSQDSESIIMIQFNLILILVTVIKTTCII